MATVIRLIVRERIGKKEDLEVVVAKGKIDPEDPESKLLCKLLNIADLNGQERYEVSLSDKVNLRVCRVGLHHFRTLQAERELDFIPDPSWNFITQMFCGFMPKLPSFFSRAVALYEAGEGSLAKHLATELIKANYPEGYNCPDFTCNKNELGVFVEFKRDYIDRKVSVVLLVSKKSINVTAKWESDYDLTRLFIHENFSKTYDYLADGNINDPIWKEVFAEISQKALDMRDPY